MKEATNFLVHEKIWLDKFKYEDAERKFYEQMNGPVTQHMSPMHQVELSPPPTTPQASDNKEEDKEARRLWEERLRQYTKKAKNPSLVAKSSILLDIKRWDDETDMTQVEACVRASKLVPVGYGIRKLHIQCVVEDKVGTDLLEEEITKFEEHVQSVDIAAFNKI
uniref:Elongation factor 1-delta n=1 Tax=Mandrillus leucophaeus TaxID=9568 RepID=A0A2K5ZTP6_MANLE